MPGKVSSPDWVQNIRGFLRDSIGPSWQIRESKGKARLGIRFEDGTRIYKNLPFRWERSQQANLRTFIEDVHRLHIEKKLPIDEAFERVKQSQPKEALPTQPRNPQLILEAWNQYKTYKVLETGAIKESTWNKEYLGKYEWRLSQVADCSSAKELLRKITQVKNSKGKLQPAGSVSRTRTVQAMAEFLRWGVSEKSNYLLPEEFTPPAIGALGDYIGSKSAKQQQKENEPIVTISDQDLERLLDSLPVNHPQSNHREATRKWGFCLKLCIAYGLRPHECSYEYLSIKGKDKPYLYCSYTKRTGKGISRPRRLWSLDPEREVDWQLLQRIKRKEPLPSMKSGAGDRFRNFLKDNPVWEELKKREGVTPYCFRHSYSRKGHIDYKLSTPELSQMMGHSPEVHERAYSKFMTDEIMESSIERAIEFRDITSK